MADLATRATAPTVSQPRAPWRRLIPATVGLALALVVPLLLGPYWVQACTATAIYAVAAMGVSLLYGRVGLVSLCQFSLLAVGVWVALRLGYAFELPFFLTILLAGAVTGVLGLLIGLPAIRLKGLYLALITLMAAAAIAVALSATQFPNGGDGFLGFSDTITGTSSLARPFFGESDSGYYVVVLVVVVALFLLVLAHLRSAPGRAWAAIRQNEAAALAAGVNVVLYKLWAFGLAAFVTGVAGGLLAAGGGGVTVYQFPRENNILLLAAALMGGVFTLWGAVAAGILVKMIPAVLQQYDISSEILLIFFGLGVIQTLLQSPEGVAAQLAHDLGRLGRRLRGGGGDAHG